jgi:hypothetical protein
MSWAFSDRLPVGAHGKNDFQITAGSDRGKPIEME